MHFTIDRRHYFVRGVCRTRGEAGKTMGNCFVEGGGEEAASFVLKNSSITPIGSAGWTVKGRPNPCCLADDRQIMSYNPRNRSKSVGSETRMKIVTTSSHFPSATNDSDMEQLHVVKDCLLTLFIGLERQGRASRDTRTQARRIQKEISVLVWMLEDWQTQIASRN